MLVVSSSSNLGSSGAREGLAADKLLTSQLVERVCSFVGKLFTALTQLALLLRALLSLKTVLFLMLLRLDVEGKRKVLFMAVSLEKQRGFETEAAAVAYVRLTSIFISLGICLLEVLKKILLPCRKLR